MRIKEGYKPILIKSLKIGFIVAFTIVFLIPGIFWGICKIFPDQFVKTSCYLRYGYEKCALILEKLQNPIPADTLQTKIDVCGNYPIGFSIVSTFFIIFIFVAGFSYLYYNRKAKQSTL